MKENVILKSVLFGGFDKKEVLEFIEKIQSEHFDESEMIKQKDEEIEAVKAKVAQLEDRLDSERKRFSALAALNDEYCERIYNLEEQIKEQGTKFESIQEDCERLKKVEAQIGALLVDAVLYSDKMTERAKTAATNITTDAKQNLVTTAEDVSRLSLEIAQISGSFRDDITALVEKVENLSTSLSTFASRFEKECDLSEERAYDGQEVFDHFISEYKNLQLPKNDEENSGSAGFSQTTENSEPVPEEAIIAEDENNEGNAGQEHYETINNVIEQRSEEETAVPQDDIIESETVPEDLIIEYEGMREPALSQTVDQSGENSEPEISEEIEESAETEIDEVFESETTFESLSSHEIEPQFEPAQIDDASEPAGKSVDKTTGEIPANLEKIMEDFEEPDELLENAVDEDEAGATAVLDENIDVTGVVITPDIARDFTATEAVEDLPLPVEPDNEDQTDVTDETDTGPEAETGKESDTQALTGTQPDEDLELILEDEPSEEDVGQNASQNRSRDISESDVDELLRLFSE